MKYFSFGAAFVFLLMLVTGLLLEGFGLITFGRPAVEQQAALAPAASAAQGRAPTRAPKPTYTPGPASAPAPTETAEPTSTPSPTPVPPLYQADWSQDANGWGGRGWRVLSGTLINDGRSLWTPSVAFAPFTPPSPDYAVEAEIQYVRTNQTNNYPIFGIVGRMQDASQGYAGRVITANGNDLGIARVAGSDWSWVPTIGGKEIPIDNAWHTYRIEFIGKQLRLFMDGELMFETTDNTYPETGKVGLFSATSEVNVRGFKVEAIE